MGVALCTRTDLYPRVDLYLHTSEKMIGGAYLFSLVNPSFLSLLDEGGPCSGKGQGGSNQTISWRHFGSLGLLHVKNWQLQGLV